LKGIAAIERFLPDNNDKSYLIIRDQRYLRSIFAGNNATAFPVFCH
jgi:hypothetical protein